MKWISVFLILMAITFMTLYEWPRIKGRKEKVTYAVLTFVGLNLSILLLFFPELPGPTKLIDTIYRPLGKLLEK